MFFNNLERSPLSILESSQRPGKKKKMLLCLLLVLMGALSGHFFIMLGKVFDPNEMIQRLEKESKIIRLAVWRPDYFLCAENYVTILSCKRAGPDNEKYPTISFPGIKAVEQQVKRFPQNTMNTVVLSYRLNAEEKEWISKKRYVSIALPRSVQYRLRFLVGQNVFETFGIGISPLFTVGAADLSLAGELRLEMDIEGLPYFGPGDLPIALGAPEDAEVYASLPLRNGLASHIQSLLLLAFPLLLVGIGLVIDHSPPFRALVVYAAAQGAWVYLSYALNQGVDDATLRTLFSGLYILTDGLRFSLFLVFVMLSIMKPKAVKSIIAGIIVSCCAAMFLYASSVGGVVKATQTSDLWSDIGTAVFGLLIITMGYLGNILRGKERRESFSSEEEHANRISIGIFTLKMAVLALALVLSCFAAIEDLAGLANQRVRYALDWRHNVLLPAAVFASLLGVGSMTNSMIAYGKKMRARLEFLLLGSKEMASAANPLDAVTCAVSSMTSEVSMLQEKDIEIYLPPALMGKERGLRKYLLKYKSADHYQTIEERVDIKADSLAENEFVHLHNRLVLSALKNNRWKASIGFVNIRKNLLSEEDEHFLRLVTQLLGVNLEKLDAHISLVRAKERIEIVLFATREMALVKDSREACLVATKVILSELAPINVRMTVFYPQEVRQDQALEHTCLLTYQGEFRAEDKSLKILSFEASERRTPTWLKVLSEKWLEPTFEMNELILPVHQNKELLAVIAVEGMQPSLLGPAEIRFMEAVCASLGSALLNIRLSEAERRYLLELVSVASQISDKLNSPLLVAKNVTEMLNDRVYEILYSNAQEDPAQKLEMVASLMEKRFLLLRNSIESMIAISAELSKLRDVARVEATDSLMDAKLLVFKREA